MGSIAAERLAKQALGSIGVTERGQQEIDGGTRGIDGPIQVAPAAFTRTQVSSTRHDLFVGLRCLRSRCSNSGP